MQEIEVKYRLRSPDEMRAKLPPLGFSFAGRVEEVNRMLDDRARRLQKSDFALRVRSAVDSNAEDRANNAPHSPKQLSRDSTAAQSPRTKHTLTFKGPPVAGKAKIREEIEVDVADAQALESILAKVGFECRLEYRKQRETWTRGECSVTLDELPQLGWFLEIEYTSVEGVQGVAAELKLSDADIEHRSYAAMTAQRS